MTDYPFRLLCKRCNSYRFTTISQIQQPRMMYNLVRLTCRQCEIELDVMTELFGHQEEEKPKPKPRNGRRRKSSGQ